SSHAILGKNPAERRYETIAWANSAVIPGRQARTSGLAVLMLIAPGCSVLAFPAIRSSAMSMSRFWVTTFGPAGWAEDCDRVVVLLPDDPLRAEGSAVRSGWF